MSSPPSGAPSDDGTPSDRERLESWKEIAVYLNRSVRTLHRWEKEEGLPVHRQLHKELGSVFAYKSELDAWSRARSVTTGAGEDSTTAPGSSTRSRVLATIALAAAAVLIGVVSYVMVRGTRSQTSGQDAPVASLELISTFPGSHRWPSLSPDGRMVAFVSDARGTQQVWIKNLATGDPVQVTFGDVPVSRPRWSPQGDRIVYSSVGQGIWSVPSLGGEPRQIIMDGSNADPSPDGRHLVFERGGQVFIAGADGSGTRVLPHPQPLKPYYGDSWPTFSPDGKSIALFLAEEGRYGDYWIVPANGDAPRRVTRDFQEGGAPAWTPDGQSLLIRSSRAGSANLWRVSIADGTLERLTSGAGEDFDPVVSPDGRTILFANVKRTWEVIVHDVRSGTRRSVLARRTLLAFPRFSPDGQRLALAGRNSRGETHLFVMDADGSNFSAVTDGAGELNVMPQWGRNGDTLYFYQVRPTQTFRKVSISGGASQEVAPWSFRHQYQAALDRGERMAVYSSVEQGALGQSRMRDLETGSEIRLPFALYEQRFSPDGRWIAGESIDHELLLCNLEGQCRALTPKSDRGLTTLAWSADGTRLFFLRHTSRRVWGELTSIGVEGGAATVHGLVGPFEHDFQMAMDLSPNGEIAYAACRESPHELWMARMR